MAYRLIAILVLAVSLAGAWLMLRPIALPVARQLQVREDAWDAPKAAPLPVDSWLKAMDEKSFWGAGDAKAGPNSAGAPLTAPDWRLVGVVSAGSKPLALLSTEGKAPTALAVGQALPGGAKIAEIGPDRIFVLLDGKRLWISTHRE